MKFIALLIIGLTLIALIFMHEKEIEFIPLPEEAYTWVKHDYFYGIAHGLGPSAQTGDNRVTTFKKGLAQGFRFFEVDLMLTTDEHVICYHGSHSDEKISYQDYVEASQASGLAPCDVDSLIQLALEHPQVYFILDVKNKKRNFIKAYRLIKEKVAAAGVGYSFIPQIYDIKQSPFIREGKIFSVEIYTGYRTGASNEEMFEQAQTLHIPALTFSSKRINQTNPTDILIFTHPVNELEHAKALKQKGIAGIYTSHLSPLLAPELYIGNK